MKRKWERWGDYHKISPDRINEIFRKAGFGEVLETVLLHGGLRNTNFKVTLKGSSEPLLFRIYVEKEMAAEETGMLNLVKGRVPVPKVLKLDESRSIIPSDYVIQTFVPGCSYTKIMADEGISGEDKRSLVRQAGEVLASIHSFTSDDSVIDFDLYESMMVSMLDNGRAGERLGDELRRKAWEYIRKSRSFLDKIDKTSRLLHADYNYHNIFGDKVEGEWKLTAVLDWEFSMYQSKLFDVGNFLRREDLESDGAAAFVEGYVKAGGSLPEGWKKIIRYMDLVAHVQMLNREKCGETVVEDLKGLVGRTVEG